MSHPPECQDIVDQIATLRAQEKDKLYQLQNLSGVDKWKAIEDLGTLRAQIAEQQVLLAECDKQHADDLKTQIDVIDLSCNSGNQRIGRVWQLTAAGQAVQQTATVQDDGSVTFVGILGTARQSFGITIEEVDHPTVNGPDFRSGPLPTFFDPEAGDPAKRIEIVILDSMVVTGETLTQAAPPLPIHLSFPAGAVGTIDIAVNKLQFVINKGDVSLSATGTASATGTTSPFTFANTFHVVPSFSMAPGVLLEILSGVPPTLSIPGLIGPVVSVIAPFVSSSLLTQVVQPVTALLNQLIATQVAKSLGLASLPSGSVLAIRELHADDQTLTVTPVLGAFGTILSGFQPPELGIAPQLAALQVQPASIGTSDPATRVAQGLVVLDGPAPTGGVTVQLSSDRPDVTSVTPPAVSIAEGEQKGTFTVTGIAQPIMPTTNVDVTVSASLGDQTLTAPLSVRPEPPATGAGGADTAFSVPVTGVPGVARLDLFTPLPLPRGVTIRGRVKLDGLTFTPTVLTIDLEPPSAPPVIVNVPAGSSEVYFQLGPFPIIPGTAPFTRISVTKDSTTSVRIEIPLEPVV